MADANRSKSLTHDHLLAVVNTELIQKSMLQKNAIRILDVGCGSGKLMVTLRQELTTMHPDACFEIYGMEVIDYMGDGEQRKAGILRGLAEEDPGEEWASRIEMCTVAGTWPFFDEFFDIVVSNQVLEHVEHAEQFFSELERVLVRGGISAHLFPLRHCLWEDHIKIPLGPRVRNYDLLTSFIRFFNRLGFGRYRAAQRRRPIALNDFAEREADYLMNYTHYKFLSDYLNLGKKTHLRTSFRYTSEYYTAKIRTIFGIQVRKRYSPSTGLGQALQISVLRYVSSVTLFLEKKNLRRG